MAAWSEGHRRATLSEDGRQMTIAEATPAGIFRIVLVRPDTEDPFSEADIRRALREVYPTLTAPGQRNVTRRWVTPVGSLFVHLMFGPPTWWLPKVRVRDGLMVGWLRIAAAVAFRRAPTTRGDV